MAHNNKVQEIIDHIKTYFTDEYEPISEESFLEIYEEYVNFVCGTESNDDKLTRISNKLYQQMESVGMEVIEKKSREYYTILEDGLNDELNRANIVINTKENDETPNNMFNKTLSQPKRIKKTFEDIMVDIFDNMEKINSDNNNYSKNCSSVYSLFKDAITIISDTDLESEQKNNYEVLFDEVMKEFKEILAQNTDEQ